jgi:hypothetical protein
VLEGSHRRFKNQLQEALLLIVFGGVHL